ncbi:MAG: hypothetical protein P8184_19640 [Calditrichia bacterium]
MWTLLKYDLNTHTFSDGKPRPCRFVSRMQMAGDTLFFMDYYYKGFLATIPFAEIKYSGRYVKTISTFGIIPEFSSGKKYQADRFENRISITGNVHRTNLRE